MTQKRHLISRFRLTAIGAFSGSILLFDQYLRFRNNVKNLTSTKIVNKSHLQSDYIYIQDDSTQELLQKFEIRGITNEFYKIMQLFFWLSTKVRGSQLYEDISFHQSLAWRLLRLAQDENYYFRQRAVRMLAQMPSLSDMTCVQLSQACDCRTAVGVARTQHADLRLLQDPPHWHRPNTHGQLLQKLHDFLFKLNQESPHPCLQYVISQLFSEADHRGFLDDVGFNVSSPDIILKSLEAILHHSWLEPNTKSVVENGGLELLVDLYRVVISEGSSVDCLIALSRTLSNVSMDPQSRKIVYMSGCVKILARLLKHPDIRVSGPAGRALLNCDVDAQKPSNAGVRFLRNVYPLHPVYRTQQAPLVDVVFIHGLLGGVFVTWRQMDPDIPSVKGKDTVITNSPVAEQHRLQSVDSREDIEEKRTQCWPRDWLPQDCPKLRVIGINYDTNISMWSPMCPISPNRLTLSERSRNLTESLLAAGLGSRPIIWVAHSMGGLIVKHLLVKCAESNEVTKRNIVEQTKGIIMFSTPHKGSQLATMRPTSQYFLWPTVEVQELRKNSPALLSLHSRFLDVASSSSIRVLSFAEEEPTFVKPLQMELQFVETESSCADVGQLYGLPLDHLTICKPAHRDSFLYRKVVHFIEKIVNEAEVKR